jgi:opacity protein-like surface antigen
MTVRRGVIVLALALGALLASSAAQAQEGFLGFGKPDAAGFLGKTDLSLVVNADITKSVSGIGESQGSVVSQSATDSGGVLLGLRHHFNPLLSFDVNYGYTRNFQNYVTGINTSSIQSGVHILTGAAVVTAPFHILGLRPYALAGGGGIFFRPTGDINASVGGEVTQVRPVGVYGAGADFEVIPHISVRGEFRGYFVQAPNFGFAGLNTGKFTMIAQPAIGVVVHF